MNNFLKTPAIIVDLDGTLTHDPLMIPKKYGYRKDRDKFHESIEYYDKDNLTIFLEMVELVKAMQDKGVTPIYITAREDEENGEVRKSTEDFLMSLELLKDKSQLLMRDYNDDRPNFEVKKSLYEKYVKGRFQVLFCLDDEENNVNMFSKLGLNVLKVVDACRIGEYKRK